MPAALDPGEEQLRLDLRREEIAELERLEAPQRRREYALSRALLRRVLVRHLGPRASALTLRRGTQGKPLVEGVHFNLSHSGGAVMLGLALDAAIGVDIQASEAPHAAAPQRVLNADERRHLESLPLQRRGAEYCRIWSVKEAVQKAKGRGLSVRVRDVEVGAQSEGVSEGCRWWSFSAGDSLWGAVALAMHGRCGTPDVRVVHDWSQLP